jgi:hypothetical protein
MVQGSFFVGIYSIHLCMAVEEAASLMSIMAMASYGRQVFHFELAGNYADIGGSLARGHVRAVNKVNCFSDDGHVGLYPLRKVANFIGGTLDPSLGL